MIVESCKKETYNVYMLITKKDLQIPTTWEERRPLFLDRMFYVPKAYEHSYYLIDWTDHFEKKIPLVVEICSGNGDWIVEQAKKFPDRNWIAIEMMFERARSIWLKIQREKIPNLFVVCSEAKVFFQYYVQDGAFSEAFVHFPDPWPKRKHAKHRLLWAPFFQLLEKKIEKAGCLTLVTDDGTYREQIIFECAKTNWISKYEHPFYLKNLSSYGSSFFFELWKSKGKEIYHLLFQNGYKTNHSL